jgi:hypothetical protein
MPLANKTLPRLRAINGLSTLLLVWPRCPASVSMFAVFVLVALCGDRWHAVPVPSMLRSAASGRVGAFDAITADCAHVAAMQGRCPICRRERECCASARLGGAFVCRDCHFDAPDTFFGEWERSARRASLPQLVWVANKTVLAA